MKDKHIIQITISVFIIILVLFIGLYFLKRKYNNVLSKQGAIKICKYIVATKVNSKLIPELTKSTYTKKENDIIINLFFNNYNVKLKTFEITMASCIFDCYIINDEKIALKTFFYQDIYKNTYMYFNTFIKLINIKTCDLK